MRSKQGRKASDHGCVLHWCNCATPAAGHLRVSRYHKMQSGAGLIIATAGMTSPRKTRGHSIAEVAAQNSRMGDHPPSLHHSKFAARKKALLREHCGGSRISWRMQDIRERCTTHWCKQQAYLLAACGRPGPAHPSSTTRTCAAAAQAMCRL